MIGDVQLSRLLRFEVERQADGNTHMLPRPPGHGHPHLAPDKIEPAQRAIFLAGRARAVAVMAHALDLTACLFLGRVIDRHFDRCALGHPPRRLATDPSPQLTPRLVQRATQTSVITRAVLYSGP